MHWLTQLAAGPTGTADQELASVELLGPMRLSNSCSGPDRDHWLRVGSGSYVPVPLAPQLSHSISVLGAGSGQLAQLVKALAFVPKGPGFEPDLAPTRITRLLSPPLAI